jgi:histidyl-tRNA synthetase
MKTNLVKGFKDSIGEIAEKRAEIKQVLIGMFKRYGFSPVETPIIEYEEFVKGDNPQDEAVSDIFKLQDKGKRKLSLRYEFTFQLKRLMKNQKLPFRRYQIGSVFRDEPVSTNRFRQFTQCDADIIGSTIKDEAELFSLAKNVLKNLGIDFVIYVNNRKLLNEIFEKEGIKNKVGVMREIDKLDKISEKDILKNLKKLKAEKVLSILKKPESYFKKYSSYSEIEELRKYCKYYKVDFKFVPSLVRGLSYYNAAVFEIKTKKMKESITAGGSFMFNDVQSTGISFGLDRLAVLAKVKYEKDKILIVSLNKDKKAVELAQKLRNKGENVNVFYGKPSKALAYANSYGIKKVIFVGAREIKRKIFKIKFMQTGKEKVLKI